jgi:hypothetical protein
MRGPRAAARRAARASPSPSGEVHVEQDGIGTDRGGERHPLSGGAGLADNLVAASREQDKRRAPKPWVIVDDQDRCSGCLPVR